MLLCIACKHRRIKAAQLSSSCVDYGAYGFQHELIWKLYSYFTVTLISLFPCADVILYNKVYCWTSAPSIGQALLEMGGWKEGNLIQDCKCLCAYIMYENRSEPSWQKTHTAADQRFKCHLKKDITPLYVFMSAALDSWVSCVSFKYLSPEEPILCPE